MELTKYEKTFKELLVEGYIGKAEAYGDSVGLGIKKREELYIVVAEERTKEGEK